MSDKVVRDYSNPQIKEWWEGVERAAERAPKLTVEKPINRCTAFVPSRTKPDRPAPPLLKPTDILVDNRGIGLRSNILARQGCRFHKQSVARIVRRLALTSAHLSLLRGLPIDPVYIVAHNSVQLF
jgi:hypothetical protein